MVSKFRVVGLKRNSDFLKLKKNSFRTKPTPWMLLVFSIQNEAVLEFGVTVSRKVGSAVVRNKLKRWCREHYRRYSKHPLLSGIKLNVIFKPQTLDFYKELKHTEVEEALQRGRLFIEKKVEKYVEKQD